MTRLIVNTANNELTLSLFNKGKVFYKVSNSKMHHNEMMLPMLDELLNENGLKISDIKEFGVVIGPGSFTGIRVGISTIKAFRDALKATAKGINNLDYLYNLSVSQNKDIETVAIFGSKDSYFVAKLVNGVVYKYPHNLTLEELKAVAENKPVGMFAVDENLDCFVPEFDAEILNKTYEQSADYELIPVYYQLSQAENEKLKRGNVQIKEANIDDLDYILEIEQQNILVNTLTKEDVETGLANKSYKTYKIMHNDVVAGFVMLQITDELNVVSIAVKKEFRNLGYGTMLLQQAEELAKELKLSGVSLEVSYNNVTAYLLYKKFGFVQRRVRKNYYKDGSHCVEMFKTV